MSTYLDSITQTTAASSASSTATKAKDDSALGKEDFLSLLVAQLKNQDPLNPDDPTQFTSQLAQFSSLEQLFNLNSSMGNLVSAYQNADRLSTLTTIGKEVAYNSDSFNYDGKPVTLGYQIDEQASKVSVVLQKNGATVAILDGEELSEGTHYLTWDGVADNGSSAETGKYTIAIQAKSAEGDTIAGKSIVRSEVTGADLEGEDGGTLITQSGNVSFSTILGVFEIDSSTNNDTAEESG